MRKLSPKFLAWCQSERFKQMGRRQCARLKILNARAPRCSATAKHTGQPCRNRAMVNGKCWAHGGKTPRGDGRWHRPVWPKGNAPDAAEKLNRKLQTLEQRAKKREHRIARMSSKDRAGYDRWKATHAPTSKAKRAAAREHERQARQALADLLSLAPTRSSGVQALYDELAAAQAHLRALDRQDELAEAWTDGIGVFG
ncbi:hypothetical protein SAMN05216566_13012 [Aureimonas phyllosphaerae]|nr:hypothetical protein SAMN05216566_13012 [Aureimonas phyllosphaerae]